MRCYWETEDLCSACAFTTTRVRAALRACQAQANAALLMLKQKVAQLRRKAPQKSQDRAPLGRAHTLMREYQPEASAIMQFVLSGEAGKPLLALKFADVKFLVRPENDISLRPLIRNEV